MPSPHYPSNPSPLQPEAFITLPLGTVKPRGWLFDQLKVQANGLTGHIEEFWPDLGPRNMWLGGDMEGWERGPYYLDGLIPLAYLLDDERLKEKAQRWIESIFRLQQEDGWLGPVQAPNRRPYDIWPVMVVLKVLTQYHEATGDPRALAAVSGFCGWLSENMDAHPLFEWGHFRWSDLILSIDWLYRRTKEDYLIELADKVHQQGYDWTDHFTNFRYPNKTKREDCTLETHVVNSAMGIKTPGVWWQHSGETLDREAVYHALEKLDRYHGQVTGIFSGDEHYAGTDPTQGTELCAVVESMFSLENLIVALGDPAFGDRLEKIAFNALPAANTPDMWAHQYDQQANQVLCTVAQRHWTNNDDTSNIFGLEPNYGCCTANLHQGWPKFTANLWMATPDEGLAAVAYGPSEVTAQVGDGSTVTVIEETEYPFRETIRFTLRTDVPVRFPLLLRIPAWADRASLSINGEQQEVPEPGTFHRIEREWKGGDTVALALPLSVRVERRDNDAVTLHRGPLVFSLKVEEEWKLIGGEPPHGDWEIYPKSAWNYGLILNPEQPEESLAIEDKPLTAVPFDTAHPPIILRAKGRRIPSWDMVQNSAGPVPQSPFHTEETVEEVKLLPYGSTQLRMTELPIV